MGSFGRDEEWTQFGNGYVLKVDVSPPATEVSTDCETKEPRCLQRPGPELMRGGGTH